MFEEFGVFQIVLNFYFSPVFGLIEQGIYLVIYLAFRLFSLCCFPYADLVDSRVGLELQVWVEDLPGDIIPLALFDVHSFLMF